MARFEEQVAAIRENVMAAKGKKAKDAKVFERQWLRASGFHPCDRNMYYQVANWRDRARPSPDKQTLFDFGNLIELAVIADLQAAGYTIIGQQVGYNLRLRNSGQRITGTIDGWITGREFGDEKLPLEIKGYAFAADRISSWRDFLDLPQPWLRQVPCQMQIYLLQAESDRGVLCLLDKKSAQVHPIPVELDYDFTEQILQRAESIYHSLELGVAPAPTPYDERLCGSCDFAHICQPLQHIEVDALGVVFNEAQEQNAEAYFATRDAFKEHQRAKTALTTFARGLGVERLLVGPAEVTVARSPATMLSKAMCRATIKQRGEQI